ncbi:EF-hand calcium-binding domain protein [Aspergillus sclerotioniger CBS 115572]|uniref:EF-hand calcium-binding domain protein n=1 Tax=Aspergillus sclerotioniger CBS 115572 TaxID=1450535 RepID=A0A317X181_9EURO|nr:EF-hand calcium-binding domain protein [Aspergillus sclerotioniger CBS 115572]PWY91352.1 EF-hand calcium-binding domain protein [Aspergillus sclerotioniger CBS 115572]
MRILCLHGKGTSGVIFKSQTSALRSRLLDLDIDFDFVDGFYQSDPAPGIDLFYPPPFFSFWEYDTTDAVLHSRDWLKNYLDTNGPYDALMMFSQGCAVGSTFSLLHRFEEPGRPLPFKAAIFICAGVPLKIMEKVGYEIAPEVWDKDILTRKALMAQADASAILSQGSSRWQGGNVFSASVEDIRKEITPSEVQINIPTVHIYGEKDPRWSAGIQLSQACDPAKRKLYDHGGGHDIPRTREVTNNLEELVRWALREGGAI